MPSENLWIDAVGKQTKQKRLVRVEKLIEEYLREALLAVEECKIKTGEVGPFRAVVREGQVDYGRMVGYVNDRSISITHEGRRLVVYGPKKWTTVLTDRDGVLVAEDYGDFLRDPHPMLTFRWGVDGNLALVKVEFSFHDSIKFVRNSEGVFCRKDDCGNHYLNWYGNRLPTEIADGTVIMGQTVRMHIEVEEELKKIMKDIELEEFVKEVKAKKILTQSQ